MEFKKDNCIMSYLWLLRFYEMSCPWNVLSMKCPVHEMSCHFNVHVSEMSCLWNVHVSEISCLWNVHVWNVHVWNVHVSEISMSLKCPCFVKCPCLWNVLSLKCPCLKCPTPFLLSLLKISYRWGPGVSHLWQI